MATRRPTRLLLPYATREEALSHLASSLPAPAGEEQAITARWQAAVTLLREAAPRPQPDMEVRDLPDSLRALGSRLEQTAEYQLLLANLKPRVVEIRIDGLIAVQKLVYSDDGGEIETMDPNDEQALFRVALPDPSRRPVAVIKDESSNSYTIASDNPNLRISGNAESEVMAGAPNGAQMPLHTYGFFVTHGGPWMQAAEFQGRWFLRDGYHRAYFLLRRGISRVPCVAVTAQSMTDLGIIRPGFVGADVLLGDRPPLVRDFSDEEWSVDGSLPRFRKVVRIRAEEFVIPTDE